MKKIFTCLLLFGTSFLGQAQDYMPMLEATACWGRKYVDNISLPPVVEQRGFFYINPNSTEIISGVEYWSLFNEYNPIQENTPIGYLREDTQAQQVFYLNESEDFSWLTCEGEEILLYDFSAEVGDTVYHCPNSDLFYVVQSMQIVGEYSSPEIDFSNIGGGRVYGIYSSQFNFSTIYEGVGSDIGPIHEFYNVSVPGTEILDNYIFGCEFIVNTRDEKEMNVSIFPNPAQDIVSISFVGERELSKVKIYNTSGQTQIINKVEGDNLLIDVKQLSRGLYFITGHDKKGKQIFSTKFVKV